VDLGIMVTAVQLMVFVLFVTDCVVIIYGFREKFRTRFNACGHLGG